MRPIRWLESLFFSRACQADSYRRRGLAAAHGQARSMARGPGLEHVGLGDAGALSADVGSPGDEGVGGGGAERACTGLGPSPTAAGHHGLCSQAARGHREAFRRRRCTQQPPGSNRPPWAPLQKRDRVHGAGLRAADISQPGREQHQLSGRRHHLQARRPQTGVTPVHVRSVVAGEEGTLGFAAGMALRGTRGRKHAHQQLVQRRGIGGGGAAPAAPAAARGVPGP